jgi:hypothetical protein
MRVDRPAPRFHRLDPNRLISMSGWMGSGIKERAHVQRVGMVGNGELVRPGRAGVPPVLEPVYLAVDLRRSLFLISTPC